MHGASTRYMRFRTSLGFGILGGVVGLAAMEVIRRATAPLVPKRADEPTNVFLSAHTMSPLGPHHEPGEPATTAIGRIAYQKLAGHPPSPRTKSALSWVVHIAYGLLVASAYGALRAGRNRRVIRNGVAFGTALWLVGDELAVPLLGLADKPTAYHPTQHAQSLAQHLGFGVATVGTMRLLEDFR